MICNTFKRLSLNTWDKISQSRAVNFQLKEETFTDLNMLEIKRNHPLKVKTKVFTKHEEGINGADWEWWFRNSKSQWIGFRIQAKIINNLSYEFEHLHYQSAKTKVFQCDKLLQKSLTKNAPKVPLYCFYIQSDDKKHLTKWTCGTFPATKDLWGCSLASAFSVKSLRAKASNHLTDLEPFLKPWHCLVCCTGYGGNDNIENIDNYVKENFPIDETITKELDLTTPETFITEKPPQYVLSIQENEKNDNIFTEDEDLRGVIIYTFDKEDQE
ncbi:MAG: hypothetical protein QM535_21345 [Limnohabitans sp.]|nr:hypothetical protein [Limnohabitans sp.]